MTNMIHLCGRASRSECLASAVPHGYRQTNAFVAGLHRTSEAGLHVAAVPWSDSHRSWLT